MKDLHELTELQMAVMNEIWTRGSATVTAVHEALAPDTGLARKTIGTMLARLEKQGLLTHRVESREFIYLAAVSQEEVRKAKVRHVRDGLFGGSVLEMVSHALESSEIRRGDIEKVRDLIAQWDRKKAKERKR